MNTGTTSQEALASVPKTPQTVGGVKGLTKVVLAGLASLGIMTSAEKVEAATILPYSNPTLLSVTNNTDFRHSTTLTWIQLRMNSRSTFDGRWTLDTPYTWTSRVSVTVPTDGLLTISWDAKIGTGALPNADGIGFGWSDFDVNQRAQFGISGWPMTDLAYLDGQTIRNNAGGDDVTRAEGYNVSQSFSQSVNVTAGTYDFDLSLEAMNTSAFTEMNNLQFSLQIPEPSVPLLSALWIGALTFRRKRDGKIEKEENITL